MPYPDSLDALDNPLASDARVGHAVLHGEVNDAIEALEAKVGVGASLAEDAPSGYTLLSNGDGTTGWGELPAPPDPAKLGGDETVEGNEALTPPGGFYVLYSRTFGNSAWVNADTALSDSLLFIERIQKQTTTLSSADILDLHNTPFELVAAPGAGKVVVVHRIIRGVKFGTVAYTVASHPYVAYSGQSSALTITGLDDLSYIVSSPFPEVGAFEDTALVIRSDDALTDGDGTLAIVVWYSIEDVPA